MSVNVVFKKIENLSTKEKEEMVEIYLKYYDSSNKELILLDLSKKSEVLLLFFNQKLIGFSSFEIYDYSFKNQKIKIIYSGDTIVEHNHWGQQSLAYEWIRYMGGVKRACNTPLYWFLIVKGHRTYRFLPAFAKSFYPSYFEDRSDLKPLLDSLAKDKFGKYYNLKSGIIEFETSFGHLKTQFAYPSKAEEQKESVQFFLKKNPNYYKGYELACLCELSVDNLKKFTKRIFDDKR